jgi:uncharacterized BrkB/YihY/UPF0761 family membrane protein
MAGEMRRLATEIVEAFRRNGLINFAASISFLIVLALIPFVLFVLALLGFLQLEEVWRDEVAPEVSERKAWWVTLGFSWRCGRSPPRRV